VTFGTWHVSVPESTLPTALTSYTLAVYATDVLGNTSSITRTFTVG
jgi:hypothetical protein